MLCCVVFFSIFLNDYKNLAEAYIFYVLLIMMMLISEELDIALTFFYQIFSELLLNKKLLNIQYTVQ